MAKRHHLLFVHGIGAHEKDWVINARTNGGTLADQLQASWNLYEPFTRYGAFDEVFKLYSIRYDDAIAAHLENWHQQAQQLKSFLSSNPQAAADLDWYVNAIDQMHEGNQNNEFAYSHLLDLLLFWGSPLIQNQLVVHTGRQIIEIVNSIRQDEKTRTDPISIVAHSLGTSMVHKTLQAVFNHEFQGDQLAGDFKFHTLVQVANCSYALSRDRSKHFQRTASPGEILVRPSAWSGQGVSMFMINANHVLDPVGSLLPYKPGLHEWLDADTRILNRYLDIPLIAITDPDIHSLTHYFRDPALHVPFFELVRGRKLTENQLRPGLEVFFEQSLSGSVKALKTRLDILRQRDCGSVAEFIQSVREFITLIDAFG